MQTISLRQTCRRSFARVAMLVLIALGAASGACAAVADPPARAVIEQFDGQLLAVMKNADHLGFAGRYKKFAPVIDDRFDIAKIARLALGREWDTLDAGQQKAYVAKFRKDTIATYATRFDGYNGEKIKVTGSRDVAGGRRQVDTELVGQKDKRTPINYVLAHADGRWRVVNVVAGGVSDLALKRGQYTSAIRSKGADGFLEQFDQQLAKYPALPSQ